MTISVVPAVTVQAISQDLTTLPLWKDDYGVTTSDDDAFIARTITRCSAAVAKYCNRTFAQQSMVETIFLDRDSYPYQTPGGVRQLQLSQWPLVSVASVVQQDSGISSTLTPFTSWSQATPPDYVVMPNEGQLIRLDSFGEQMIWPAVVYIVTYVVGYILPVGAWAASSLYQLGTFVYANGNVYQATQAGTSNATGGGPAGTGSGISDGTVVWSYVQPYVAPTLPPDVEDAVGRMVYTRYIERKRDPFIRSKAIASGGTTTYWGGAAGSENMSQDVKDLLGKYRVPVNS